MNISKFGLKKPFKPGDLLNAASAGKGRIVKAVSKGLGRKKHKTGFLEDVKNTVQRQHDDVVKNNTPSKILGRGLRQSFPKNTVKQKAMCKLKHKHSGACM